MKIKKIAAVILCAALVAGLLCSCVDTSDYGSVGGVPISKGDFSYYATYALSSIINENQIASTDALEALEIDGKKGFDAVIERTYREIATARTIELLFDEAGLTVTGADEENVDAYIQQIVTGVGGQSAFQSQLSSMGITQQDFRRIQMRTIKYSRLYDYYTQNEFDITDEQMKERFLSDYVRVKHVLIKTRDDNYVPLSDEEIADARARAESILEAIEAGTPFEDFLSVSEDPGMENYPDGYIFTYGQMDESFETAAFALQVGEVSGLVEGFYGFHIIKKYDLMEKESFFEDEKSMIYMDIAQDLLDEKLQERLAQVPLERNDRKAAKFDFRKLMQS